MYDELLQIIKGGIEKNPQKVFNYSKKLAETLENEGDRTLSKKINKVLKENDMRSVTLDSLRQKPFDKDSHLDIVDVKMPTDEYYEDMNLFFSESIENEILSFIQSYRKKDSLIPSYSGHF